ncbi:uncharacterized protein [Mytilus edulis]|uniref:uncharacterized protein n=1 Tax=Mytilus edulis TaxID=6550 RepID=UPI0039EF9C8E
MAVRHLTIAGICLIFIIHYVYTASVVTTTAAANHHTTTAAANHHTTTKRHHHHGHHVTHSAEKIENDHLYFHYDSYSIEKLLVAKQHTTCYAYPLSSMEIQNIHKPATVFELEAHVLHQIQIDAYYNWTHDDISVRSTYYTKFCPHDGHVFRVHRL